MLSLDPRSFPMLLNLALFAAASAVVWFAGTSLSSRADAIADRTGLGKAFVGLVLLAGATSLPEIATTVTASTTGNAALATNNLLGGIAMQTAILALADGVVGRGALTYLTPRPVLLLQGLSLVLLLAVLLVGLAAGPLLVLLNVSIWSIVVFVLYLVAMYLIQRYEGHGRWRPVDPPGGEPHSTEPPRKPPEPQHPDKSTRRIGLEFAGLAAVVLVAGYLLARTGDALAAQTGLGPTFVGATLLAIATSLPEVSTTIQAARLHSYSMAVANIFGSNALMVALLLPADLLYRGGSILEAADRSVSFGAALGIAVTTVYLIGLVEREDRTVGRLGIDSVVVLVLYLAGLGVLYLIR